MYKAFREHSRIENALVGYNDELIKLLKSESLKTTIKQHKVNNSQVMIVQVADTHFNELVSDLKNNKYDFEIASKRLQKFAHYIKEYANFYNIKEIFIGITGLQI